MSNPKSTKGKKALEKVVRGLEDEFLFCRDLGHQWAVFVTTKMRKPYFGRRRSMRCLRCGTERHELINTYGNVGARSYKYPENYELKGYGRETQSRSQYRAEWMRRTT